MLISLLIVPLIGSLLLLLIPENNPKNEEKMKVIALSTSLINLFISILLWIQFDSSISDYQFILEFNELSFCHFNSRLFAPLLRHKIKLRHTDQGHSAGTPPS